MKKFVSIILAIFMVFSLCVCTFAADKSLNYVAVGDSIVFAADDEDEVSLPTTWDSRDYNLITSVKDQGFSTDSWAFATCAAAEASLIKHGYGTKDTVNLSEAHLIRFLDPYVEGSDIPVQKDHFKKQYCVTVDNTAGIVTRGSGFVTENKYPFKENLSDINYSSDYMFDCDYTVEKIECLHTRETIKQGIMETGAVAANYYYNEYYVSWPTGESPSTLTYYQNKYDSVSSYNDSLTIIGWDDDFSADNFHIKPEGNGAWLCKLSRGNTTTIYGVQKSITGYMWVSYYDGSLKYGYDYFLKIPDYDYIYQYNGNFANCSYSSTKSNSGSANVFTAKGNEYIEGVGFDVADDEYDCTVSLYVDLTSPSKSPTNGTLIESIAVHTPKAGYYTVKFQEKHKLEEGQIFSLVVNVKATIENKKAFISMESTYNDYEAYCEKGQSFYMVAGSMWYDVTKNPAIGNAAIKGLVTFDESETKKNSLQIDKLPTKTEFITSDKFDYSGLKVSLVNSEGVAEDITDYNISTPDMTKSGMQQIIITYNELKTSYDIYITDINDFIVNKDICIDKNNNTISGFSSGFANMSNYFYFYDNYTYTCSRYATDGDFIIYHNNIPICNLKILVYGDLDKNGTQDGMDSVILQSILKGFISIENVSQTILLAADCNHDGEITQDDVRLIEMAGLKSAKINQLVEN